jgi:fructoselysine-6-phosphate deglycase
VRQKVTRGLFRMNESRFNFSSKEGLHMFNFDKGKFLNIENGAIALKGEVEKVVDELCKRGYKNLFFVGIGGTISYAWQIESVLKSRSTIDFYVENAADFVTLGNKRFTKDSIVIVDSASGDTKEVVAAVKYAKEKGATVIGFIEKKGTPLAEAVDYLISSEGGSYYKLCETALRFMYNANEFPEYERFFEELKSLPEALLQAKEEFEDKAIAYVDQYKDEPIQYLVGSGNTWGWTYCYAMCIMEEMQWMRTKSIQAAEFFHGTLEVIDRDTSVVLFIGEDETRPLMERVEKFVHRVSDKVTVVDTKDYELKGISEEFRGLVSPFVMIAVCERISKHLEEKRKHPLEIRRYYRRLDY